MTGIGLRGYGQKDPLIEYKREGFDMFSGMMDRIKSDVLERMFRVQAVRGEQPPPPPPEPVRRHEWCSIAAMNRRHKTSNAAERSAATTPVLAAAARNTKNVTEHSPRGGGKILLTYGSWSRLPLHLVLSFRVFSR